jgi:hypothetical protein
MNWRRGMFRLWLVASVLWIGLMSVAGYARIIVPWRNGADFISISSDIAQFFAVAFGPVLAVLMIGTMVGWVLSGFRRRPG